MNDFSRKVVDWLIRIDLITATGMSLQFSPVQIIAATLTSKGQITPPNSVRDRLGVEAGDRIEFIESGRGFLVALAEVVWILVSLHAVDRSGVAETAGFDLLT